MNKKCWCIAGKFTLPESVYPVDHFHIISNVMKILVPYFSISEYVFPIRRILRHVCAINILTLFYFQLKCSPLREFVFLKVHFGEKLFTYLCYDYRNIKNKNIAIQSKESVSLMWNLTRCFHCCNVIRSDKKCTFIFFWKKSRTERKTELVKVYMWHTVYALYDKHHVRPLWCQGT